MVSQRPLGEMLVESGVITAHDLKVALTAQREHPTPLGVTLVQLGIAREEEILPILAQQLNQVNVSLHPERDRQGEPTTVPEALQQLLVESVQREATDLHMEPMAKGVRFRIRIDGILHELEIPTILKLQYPAAVSRIKVLCNMDIAEKRMPQEGRTTLTIQAREIDLRISILPSRYGESVAIRFLQPEAPMGLASLGMDPTTLEALQAILRRRSGMILATGPTGSGKTTTLYACLDVLNDNTRKIVTVEDPIEYTLPGAIQMQVQPMIDLTFGRLLRTILRHDPNIIMVGEVRDTETAEVAIRMALTGHLVLSTLHTNDAASTITRLLEMGMEAYLVASSLSCAIAQRLVRTICRQCQGRRCATCLWSGFKGRTGIFECLVVNDEIRQLVLKHASSEEIRERAKRSGMRTLYEDGLAKVQAGLTTQDELDRVIQQDEL